MKKIVCLIVCLIIGIIIYSKEDEIIIPSDAIRIRIIANSNNISDLYQKRVLKEEINNELYDLVKNAASSNEAGNIIKENLDNIKKMVYDKNSSATISYGLNYFPKKVYKGVIYPEGEYESLLIKLGDGLGDNWWCVLYPPLCMINDNKTTSNVEYQFMIQKILSNIK